MCKNLLLISQHEDGRFSVTSDYILSQMNADEMVPEIENALERANQEALEAMSLLFLAYFGASERLDLNAVRKRPRRLRDMESCNPELLQRLSQWRRGKALEKDVPQFMIASNKVLLAIADIAPLTREALLSVSGFGPVMFDRYGDEILEITHSFFEDDTQ